MHAPCKGEDRFGCPCWQRGAREEAEVRRARPATRELTDYIKAVGDYDPTLTSIEMAVLVHRVFVESAETRPRLFASDDSNYLWNMLVGRMSAFEAGFLSSFLQRLDTERATTQKES